MDKLIKWLTAGGIILGIEILLIGLFTGASPTDIELVSHSFSNIFIGLGGLFATAGGLVVIDQYLESQKQKQKLVSLRLKYPESDFGTNLEVINTRNNLNKLYLLIVKENVVRWIGNRDTYHDLWFNKMKTKTVEDTDFAYYTEGDLILTRGVTGT